MEALSVFRGQVWSWRGTRPAMAWFKWYWRTIRDEAEVRMAGMNHLGEPEARCCGLLFEELEKLRRSIGVVEGGKW